MPPLLYGHYTGQRALSGTSSQEEEDFVGAVLLPACPCYMFIVLSSHYTAYNNIDQRFT